MSGAGVLLMPPGSPPPEPEDRPFGTQGRIDTEFWGASDSELMLSGPAGTGKSRAILEYIYALAREWPGSRHAIVRQTRASLTDSALVTFEDHVVQGRPAWVGNNLRSVRKSYLVPGRERGFSEIVVRGLDRPDRFMSTEFDTIYVQEAREIEEGAWEALSSRLRNDVLPFQMLLGDTNPDGPTHWILQRARAQRLRLIETRHEDNPAYFNAETGQLTRRGRVYIERLDSLTGLRHKRLRLGLWVGGENLIYDLFDPALHVVSEAAFRKARRPSWPIDLSVDFGYSHVFVAQWWAEDPEGRIYLYRELYGTQRLTKDWAHRIFEVGQGEKIRRVITDHDISARLDLENHMGHRADECPDSADTKKGRSWTSDVVGTVPAIKDVQRGIQAVQGRLTKARDGFPRLFLVENCRLEVDERLVDEKRPTCTAEEFPRYMRAKKRSLTAGEVLLEEPVKKDDDGLDALRYRVMDSDADLYPVARLYGQAFREDITP